MKSNFKIAGVKVSVPGTNLNVELGEASGNVEYGIDEIKEGLGFISSFAKFLMAEVVPVARDIRKENQQRWDVFEYRASKEADLREELREAKASKELLKLEMQSLEEELEVARKELSSKGPKTSAEPATPEGTKEEEEPYW